VAKGDLKDPKPHAGFGVIKLIGGPSRNIFSLQIDKDKALPQAFFS